MQRKQNFSASSTDKEKPLIISTVEEHLNSTFTDKNISL